MKKTLFIIIFCLLIGTSLAFFVNRKDEKAVDSSVVATPTVAPEVSVSFPETIIINKIGVEAFVEQVGKDSEGKMDIPSDFYNTAWYRLGPKPGEVGNAVIAGHLDTPTGAPSTFWSITNLEKGDQIEVLDREEEKYIFSVTDIANYRYDQFPINEVFGPSNKKRLNLITCGGTFDASTKNYSNRTVVFSELLD